MSRTTREINKITGAVIGISGKLIIYAIVVLLLFEGVTKGYAFGHEVFYSTAVSAAPGIDKEVVLREGLTAMEAGELLKGKGLIKNEYAFYIQAKFYDYKINPGTYTLNTSMTSKEMLQILNEVPEEEEKTS